jgi:hypothetical protein
LFTDSFFINYHAAISDVGGLVTGNIGKIVQITNPIKKTNLAMDSVMQAITSGLAFVPGPEAYFGKAILNAAAQSAFVTKFAFPVGTADSQLVEMQDLAKNASTLIFNLTTNIAQMLPPIENDVNAFAAAASNGAFSQQLPPLDSLATNAWQGLNAYLISQAYQANNVFITRQLNTSVRALMTNGTDLSYQLTCTSGKSYSHAKILFSSWRLG